MFEKTSQDRIYSSIRVGVEFFNNVLEENFHDCFLTDESSLSDFYVFTPEKEEVYKNKIKEIYGLELNNSSDEIFINIFERIKEERRKKK
jgi:hypothetical protein